MKTTTKLIAITLGLVAATISNTETVTAAAAANLNQGRNGTDSMPVNPVNWVNGNMGTSNAHYLEEMSAPFQCVMTGLTAGEQITLVIGYDVRNSGKHAYDYLTHYKRLEPHSFNNHSTAETINMLDGTGLGALTLFTTYPIPAPSSAGSLVAGQPATSFNTLPASERLMTLYNGTIDTIYYVVHGSLTEANSESRIAIRFTSIAATSVLAWGGHIASRNDWGYSNGAPNSAGGISGSPFHMRLVSWTKGNIGNQDKSLAGPAVGSQPSIPLPVELVLFTVNATERTNTISWSTASEINNNYFILERSTGIESYEAVARIEGAGNSTSLRDYSWEDEQPMNGVSYYRLVQTDFDGAQKIYGPLSVRRIEKNTSLSVNRVHPNLVGDDFTLSYVSATRCLTSIEIFDTGGKRSWFETVTATAGNNYYRCDMDALPNGMYFITISQKGNNPVTTIIIKG